MLDSRNLRFFAHSIDDRDRDAWQLLPAHLQEVDADCLGALIDLLHDLGKYAREFQDYIDGRGKSPDHATAGAREILKLAAETGPDRVATLISAYCIAGHHSGLSDWSGDRALSDRLKKQLPPLDYAWRRELAPVASGLLPAFPRASNGLRT